MADDALDRLNGLDEPLEAAIAAHDEEAFGDALDEPVSTWCARSARRSRTTSCVASDLLLPHSDASLAEVRGPAQRRRPHPRLQPAPLVRRTSPRNLGSAATSEPHHALKQDRWAPARRGPVEREHVEYAISQRRRSHPADGCSEPGSGRALPGVRRRADHRDAQCRGGRGGRDRHGLGRQWYFSDKLALASMRARVVTPEQAPELHGMIDRLCALADMPKPTVAIADTDLPNAFATGRSPSHSVVCVTTGLMRRLDAEELEGVLSHELAHVAHRDVAVMTVAVVRWGSWPASSCGGSRSCGDGRDRNDNGAPMFLVVWIASIVAYVIRFLLTRVLSRYRELSADRSGAYLTGKPSALASALTKITGDMAPHPQQGPAARIETISAFFFATPAFSRDSLAGLLSYPPARSSAASSSSPRSRPTSAVPSEAAMGLWNSLMGRSKPAAGQPRRALRLPSAAITLEAAAGIKPTGLGSVCYRQTEGAAFARCRPTSSSCWTPTEVRRSNAPSTRTGSHGWSSATIPSDVGRARHRPPRRQQHVGRQRVRPAAALLGGGLRHRRRHARSVSSTSTSAAPSTRSRRSPSLAVTTRSSSRSAASSARTCRWRRT